MTRDSVSETVRSLLKSVIAYHVLLGSRSAEKGQAAVKDLMESVPNKSSTVETVVVDVASDRSIQEMYQVTKEKWTILLYWIK